MTHEELRALAIVLCDAVEKNKPVPQAVLRQAAQAAMLLGRARLAFSKCQGHHLDECNSYMGWGDKAECDCPHSSLKAALRG